MSDDKWMKRAQDLMRSATAPGECWTDVQVEELALQLGREMADARAEEIAVRILRDALGPWEAASFARSTISKPKTRKQVLEEALDAIAKQAPVGHALLAEREYSLPRADRMALIAIRALNDKQAH